METDPASLDPEERNHSISGSLLCRGGLAKPVRSTTTHLWCDSYDPWIDLRMTRH